MFTREGNVYQSSLLSTLPWLRHGFGTKDADGWLGDYTYVKQIHSDLFYVADGKRGVLGQADAILVSEPGNPVGIRTADCVSLILADAEKHVAAVIHAGWKGTAAGITLKVMRQLSAQFDAKSHTVLGAIGPCIGPCCFEVGPEVVEQFRPWFPERELGRMIDLPEANRRQLLMAGLKPENIESSGLCTKCDLSQFHSWRRDRESSGRMVSGAEILF